MADRGCCRKRRRCNRDSHSVGQGPPSRGLQHFLMDCTAGILVWGVIALPMGVLALALGLTVWQNPNSPLIKHFVEPSQFKVMKFLGPILGVGFILVGASAAIQQLRCGSYAQLPHLLNLAWSWWPGIWPATAIAVGIGIWNARNGTYSRHTDRLIERIFWNCRRTGSRFSHRGLCRPLVWNSDDMRCLSLDSKLATVA